MFYFRLFALLIMTVLTSSVASGTVAEDERIRAMVDSVSANDLRAIDAHLVGFGTRNDFSETLGSRTRGVFAARDWIRSQFDSIGATTGGRMTVTLDTFTHPETRRTPREVVESSVIATLRGETNGPVYIMSSHYDDCNGKCIDGLGDAPGADDNGSGATAVIEAAKVMSRMQFRGTIVFAVFDGEELGLWGSQHYADKLRKNGTRVAADLNNDIIGAPNADPGSPDSRQVRIFSEALPAGTQVDDVNLIGSENDSPSRELARFVQETDALYVPAMRGALIYRADRFLRGGDQESFTADGFPAIRFVELREDFRHQHQDVRTEGGVQYGDLLQFIDFDYLAQVTRMNVAALAALSLGPDEPEHVQMVAAHLTNDTTLRWERAAGAVRYEIVWRDTTSPVWQHAQDVGDVTQVTVPVSKDDAILGVRSVDADGLRSPVVYPSPTVSP